MTWRPQHDVVEIYSKCGGVKMAVLVHLLLHTVFVYHYDRKVLKFEQLFRILCERVGIWAAAYRYHSYADGVGLKSSGAPADQLAMAHFLGMAERFPVGFTATDGHSYCLLSLYSDVTVDERIFIVDADTKRQLKDVAQIANTIWRPIADEGFLIMHDKAGIPNFDIYGEAAQFIDTIEDDSEVDSSFQTYSKLPETTRLEDIQEDAISSERAKEVLAELKPKLFILPIATREE